ncbi:MAG TPA: hypothetical protein EYQ50_07765 [Verrucomicrobiales bacterium]|jgi:hypothetical protein|nr:hypothetical protein [Verrucomicrobiales bacterium]
MKRWQFYTTLMMGTIGLVLVLFLIWIGFDNGRLQGLIQTQRSEITKGNLSQKVGLNLLADMAKISVANTNMKTVLRRNGYNVEWQPDSTNRTETVESSEGQDTGQPLTSPLEGDDTNQSN